MWKLGALFILIGMQALANSTSLGFASLTYHTVGLEFDRSFSDRMVRKITPGGELVYNPELSLTLERDGRIFNATYINDCFGDHAYFVGAGKEWTVSPTLNVGLLGGIYVRPHYDDRPVADNFHNDDHDILPMPFFFIQKNIPIDEKYSFSIQMGTNYALTHLLFGVNWKD